MASNMVYPHRPDGVMLPVRHASVPLPVLVVIAALTILLSLVATASAAGRSSTGKLAFDPCTKCHPVTLGSDGKPTKPLPIGLEQHKIELEAHDILGEGDKACLACHDDPTKNPGMLKLADGSLVAVTGDVSRVCQRCHFEKYRDFQAGVHGKRAAKCSAAGCHDPHTPSWIYVAALPPFQGTGFEARAMGDREPFTPFASPPVPTPVVTPSWLSIASGLGGVFALGMVGLMIRGRSKR